MLALARKHGAGSVKGYDLSRAATEFGKAQFGLDLVCGRVEDGVGEARAYDVVVMIDVIEHFYDLRKAMEVIRAVLRDEGTVYFVTPNWWGYHYAGAKWIGLEKDFEHLQYFSEQSVDRLAAAFGLRKVSVRTEGAPIALWQYQVGAGSSKRWRRLLAEPPTALRNGCSKLRFGIANALHGHQLGHNLHCVLRA